MEKLKSILVFYLFFIFLFFTYLFLPSKVFAQIKVICPTGVAGQGGCDYIGGDGIQQAVNEAPQGNSNGKTKIIIKSGTYTRNNFTEFTLPEGNKRKCFIDTKEKYLIFEGENFPVLDGAASMNMSGFCSKGAQIEIKNLIIRGFKKDDDSCFSNDRQQPCSRGCGVYLGNTAQATITNNQITSNQTVGVMLSHTSQATITNNQITSNQYGVILYNTAQATITNNQITSNQDYGVILSHTSQATITNNQITSNQDYGVILYNTAQATITNNQITSNQDSGVALLNTAQATITNNTISFNRVAGINIYSCGEDNPSVTAKNNIITHTKKNTDNTYGFGIGGGCINTSGKLNNDNFSYNLIWGNEGDGRGCGGSEFCGNFVGKISADPQFANPQGEDFRLKSTSPAIDTGDPSITDKNGSRSDMGAWGGQNPLPLVLNGSFELDWFGWEKNGVGRQEIITEGGRGKVLYQSNNNAGSRVIQWVPIQNKKLYQLTLNIRGSGNVGGGPLARADEWCLGSSNDNNYIKGQQFSFNNTWSEKKWEFEAGDCPTGKDHRLAIFFDTNDNYKGEIWVDNVNLQGINSIAPTPTHTPTPTPTRTPTPTPTQIITPTNVPGCQCDASSQCSSVCPVNQAGNQFTDVTYDSPIKCSLGQGVSMPTPASREDKNSWCNRPQRTKGDATGDGVVNEMDYAVYLRAVLGAPIASSYNPDFDGDGKVSSVDLLIWKKSF